MGRVGIVGAGAVGLASAHFLQTAGHEVTLIDGGGFASGASFGNACTFASYASVPVNNPSVFRNLHRYLLSPTSPLRLRTTYLPRMLPWLLSFLRYSTRARSRQVTIHLSELLAQAGAAYRPLIERVGGAHVIDRACMYLYASQQSYEAARPDLALRGELGVSFDVLEEAEIQALEPALAPRFARGVLFNDSWFFRSPYAFLTTLGDALVGQGAAFVRGNALAIQPTDEGVRVEVTGGSMLDFDHVVVACGAHSRHLAQQCGNTVPLDTERGYHVLFPGAAGLVTRPCGWAERGIYMTPMQDGLRAAGTVELGGFSPARNSSLQHLIRRSAAEALPDLQGPSTDWLGFRPTLPDGLPVIDRSRLSPRVIYAFGHQHLGLTLAAITGQIVLGLVERTVLPLSPEPFRADRF